MKLITFVTAFACLDFVIANPRPTGLAVHNAAWAILKRGAHLLEDPSQADKTHTQRKVAHARHKDRKKARFSWDPPDAYQHQYLEKKKTLWESKCYKALTRAGCRVGIMHQGETKVTRNGQKTSYIHVEGAPSMDLMKNSKKMRVFHDGSSEELHDWSERDRTAIRKAKRRPRKDNLQLRNNQKALLFWTPADAYESQREKRAFWEKRCDIALARLREGGCEGGTIYKGERRLTKPNGEKSSYVNVEAAPSMGMDHGKKMRVFEDGSSELVDRWSARDLKLISDSKRPKSKKYRKEFEKAGSVEANASSQAPNEEFTQNHPKYDISWYPPHAYAKYNRMRKSFERACQSALEREGCDYDYGVIHKGYHVREKTDGTNTHYLLVAAGKKDVPGSRKYMTLYEDGSSAWYPQGPLPQEDTVRGVNARPSAPYKRLKGWQKKQSSPDTQVPPQEPTQDNPKRRRIGEAEYQHSETHVPTQAEYPGRVQAPGGDGPVLNDTFGKSSTQAISPERFNSGDGVRGLDLNFPPPGAASPEPSWAPVGGN